MTADAVDNNNNNSALRGRTTPAFSVSPEQLVVVKDPKHALFRESALLPPKEDLVASIMKYGVIQALIVRKNGDKLEVSDGRKRVAAALEANKRLKAAGEPEIKCVITLRGGEDKDIMGASVAVNIQRYADDPISNAYQARRMINFGSTIKDLTVCFNKSVATIENWLKLDDLHPEIKKLVENNKLKYTVAMRLARLPRERQLGKLKKILRAGATNANAVRAVVNGRLESFQPPEKSQLRRVADELLKAKAFQQGDQASDSFSFVEWVLGRISTDELLSCLSSGVIAGAVKSVTGGGK